MQLFVPNLSHSHLFSPSPIHIASTFKSTMSASLTTDGNHINDYSDLQVLLQTLQTNSLQCSFSQQTHPATPSFHTFFLIHLPLLLTTQRPKAIHNLRIAYITVMHLNFSSSLEQSFKTRYVNFGSALLWELDRADHLIQSVGDFGDFEIMNAVRTIFHLVASLCYREWDMDQPTLLSVHGFVDAFRSATLASTKDPVYYPPRVSSRSGGPVIVGDASERVNPEQQVSTNLQHRYQTRLPCASQYVTHEEMPFPAVQPLSSRSLLHQVIQSSELDSNVHIDNSAILTRPSDYIRNNGKHILPAACIKETRDGCHVPCELSVQNNNEEECFQVFDLLGYLLRVSYPDNTHLSYIPIQEIRLLNYCAMNGFAEQDEFNAMATVEMSTKVYETLINRLKQAYITKFPDRSPVFLTDLGLQHPISDRIVEIQLPILPDCFARVVHLLWFVEHPLCDALEMCQHDVSGCGLLQAELVEGPDGIRIVIWLAGVVVERNLLNYGERIFELLETGVGSEL